MKFLLLALGGGLGATLRYGLSTWISGRADGFRPLATVVVNVLGCFAIGLLVRAGAADMKEEWRIGILVGLLGGFTTFSTYALESFQLAEEGQRGAAVLNLVLSNLFGLGALWLGHRLGASFAPR